jgi:hypothetical protein
MPFQLGHQCFGAGGRRKLDEEKIVLNAYLERMDKFFAIIDKALKSKNPAEKKWAAEKLHAAYVKRVPQVTELAGPGGGPVGVILFPQKNYDDSEEPKESEDSLEASTETGSNTYQE